MPFLERSKLSLKKEFTAQIAGGELSMSELCRRFEISRPTGYKWARRFNLEGAEGLEEKSRRPHESPARVRAEVERAVLEVRDEHPKWGARKIKRFLENRGHRGLPSPSTITAVLARHGRLDAEGVAKTWSRFERERPMDLLQMDFKGHFPIRDRRCHPLSLDLKTPSERFQMSSRRFPEVLPEIVYGPDDQVRKVQDGGIISFRGVHYRVGRALRGLPVAVRPTAVDEGFDVFCVRQNILHINVFSPLGGREE